MKERISLRLLLATLCFSQTLFTNVAVVSADPALTLNDLRVHALSHSPAVTQIDAQAAEKLGDAIALQQLENPVLSANTAIPVSYSGSRPENDTEVSIGQELRLSDFGARRAVSSLIDETATQNQKLSLQRFVQKLTLSYLQLWALQLEEQHISTRKKQGERIASIIKGATSDGRVSIAQQKTAIANVARANSALLGVHHEQTKAAAELMRLSSFDVQSRKLKKPELSSLPSFDNFLDAVQNNDDGMVGRYELRAKLAKQQLQLAKKDAYPAFRPQLSYSQNDEGNDFIGIGFSVPLPVFGRNQGEIKKQSAKHSSRSSALRYVRSPLFESELRMLHQGARIKLEQAKRYEQEVLPPLREALDIAERSFSGGQMSLFELWAIHLNFYEALDESTQLWVEAFAGATELSILSGKLLL